MNILLVEDNKKKRRIIRRFLDEIFENVNVTTCASFSSGLKEIYSHAYDILLLDMSMPTYDVTPSEAGGKKRAMAGKEIMLRMIRKKIYIPVIVITQFEKFGEDSMSLEDLNTELSSACKDIWITTIHFDEVEPIWKNVLLKAINSILEE